MGEEELVVRFREKELLTVRCDAAGAGDMTVVTGSNINSRRKEVLNTLNEALAPLGIKIKFSGDDIRNSEWFVSDGGRFMKKFVEGLVIPPRIGLHAAARASKIQEALTRDAEDRELAARAAAASNSAALNSGLASGPSLKIGGGIGKSSSVLGIGRQKPSGAYRPY